MKQSTHSGHTAPERWNSQPVHLENSKGVECSRVHPGSEKLWENSKEEKNRRTRKHFILLE